MSGISSRLLNINKLKYNLWQYKCLEMIVLVCNLKEIFTNICVFDKSKMLIRLIIMTLSI